VTIATATTPALDPSLRTAVASRARPRRPTAFSTSLTFAWRALLKIKHGPDQLTDAIFIPVLFTVLFTYLLGGALAGSSGQYLRFLLPGTLVMTVLLVTVYAGLGLRTDLTSGVLDRYRSMPVWRPALIVGGLVGDAGRYLLSSAIVMALGLVMGFRADGGVVGVLLAIALVLVFAFSLSWIWTTLGLLVRTPNAVVMVSFLVQLPLTFASNVFVDPATLPGWLRAFVDVNPVSHLVTTVRELMYGTATAGQVGSVLLVSAALVAVFAPLTMRLYRIKQ
jgi:ABC-2 type transport system permease protein